MAFGTFKEYPETHQQGAIDVSNLDVIFGKVIPTGNFIKGDLGIQIAKDGRVWVCINGIAFIRFSPLKEGADNG